MTGSPLFYVFNYDNVFSAGKKRSTNARLLDLCIYKLKENVQKYKINISLLNILYTNRKKSYTVIDCINKSFIKI